MQEETTKEIIYRFLEEYHYLDNKHILGILFHGSRNNHTEHENSDIDLLIVKDSGADFKCATYIKEQKIDYCENNIHHLLEAIDVINVQQNLSLYSIFLTGTILYEREGALTFLKSQVENTEIILCPKIQKGRPEKINYLSSLLRRYTNSCLASFIYYNTLEEIRKFYHEKKGYSQVRFYKLYRSYTNIDEAENIYKLKLPPKTFRDRYLQMLRNPQYSQIEECRKAYQIPYIDKEYFPQNFYLSEDAKKRECVTLANILEKCIFSYMKKTDDFLSIYYVLLERMRSFYAKLENIDTLPCDLYSLDSVFLQKMEQAIRVPNLVYLQDIFTIIKEKVSVDLKHYRIKYYL